MGVALFILSLVVLGMAVAQVLLALNQRKIVKFLKGEKDAS